MVFKTKEKAKTWIPDKRFREWRNRQWGGKPPHNPQKRRKHKKTKEKDKK